MDIGSAFSAGRLTLSLSGELDHHAAREAMDSIGELLDAHLPRECALELSGLRFMDSSGVALIVRVSRRMRDLGGRLWIENPGVQVQRVLKAAGIDRLVPVAVIGGST